ncbi:hypothetical protein DFJ74DRAFT_228158 [Hyaloraphidium curvatum]|nr:hypothetical protein DFJ74DRAFT_228158 [Hyaloraphidium curvatum]
MTDPAQATTLLFPGLVWNPAWSSGRFNIVPGQHILEIRMVNKGDGTGGTLVMSALEHQCSISPRSTNSTPLYMGTMLIDREPHVFFPSAPTEWIVNVPNNSSCLDLTVIDAVCGGDSCNAGGTSSWMALRTAIPPRSARSPTAAFRTSMRAKARWNGSISSALRSRTRCIRVTAYV